MNCKESESSTEVEKLLSYIKLQIKRQIMHKMKLTTGSVFENSDVASKNFEK